jgi:hypothetical protein
MLGVEAVVVVGATKALVSAAARGVMPVTGVVIRIEVFGLE